MRICPNYEVNPIDVEGLYNLEKSLFGVMDNGVLVTPCEFFCRASLGDGRRLCRYLLSLLGSCPHPVRALPLFQKRTEDVSSLCAGLLFVNLIGFAGYYIHPAAPPWYAINYGFEPILNTPGNVAGLGRFDEIFGVSVFDSIYGRNANVFAAVPSLHAKSYGSCIGVCHHRQVQMVCDYSFFYHHGGYLGNSCLFMPSLHH